MVEIPAVESMSDETFIKHLEKRHSEDVSIKFPRRPGEADRHMDTRTMFESLHALRHRQEDQDLDHEHEEA
jgi:hypothetical protein